MSKILISVISFLSVLILLIGGGLAVVTSIQNLPPWYYAISGLCLLCFLFGLGDVLMLRSRVNSKVRAKTQKKIEQEAARLAQEQLRSQAQTPAVPQPQQTVEPEPEAQSDPFAAEIRNEQDSDS